MSLLNVDNTIVKIKTVDNASLVSSEELVDSLEGQDLSVNSLSTNLITSIDDDLVIRHHSLGVDQECFKATASGVSLMCDLELVGPNPGDSNYVMKIDGNQFSLSNQDQVAGLADFILDEVIPGDVRFVVQIPPLSGTEVKGNYEYGRFNDVGVFVLREFATLPVDNALTLLGYTSSQPEPHEFSIRQRVPNAITGTGTGNNYALIGILRSEKGIKISTDGDPTETLIAKFTENTSELYRPIKYTGSTPTDGYFLQTDGSGNMTWAGHRLADAYWDGNAASTVLTPAGTFIKSVVTSTLTTLNPNSMGGWDLNGVENRLRYTGARGGTAQVQCTLSLTGSNNKTFACAIYKNGVIVPGGTMRMSTASTAATTSSAIHCITSIVTNDYFEVWVACIGSTDSVQVIQCTIESNIVG